MPKKLTKQGDALVIRPITKNKKRGKHEIKKIAQEIMDNYADVFKKLAR